MESRRLKMEAFTPMPSASLGAGAATATAAAGYGKVAFPRRVARETGHPGRRWLQRYFREALLAARRRRGAWASGCAGRAELFGYPFPFQPLPDLLLFQEPVTH